MRNCIKRDSRNIRGRVHTHTCMTTHELYTVKQKELLAFAAKATSIYAADSAAPPVDSEQAFSRNRPQQQIGGSKQKKQKIKQK